MVRLTRAGEYAIRGMVHLARQPRDQLVLISQIAESEDVSVSFLAKIFQSLAKAGLIESQRGATGGVNLNLMPEQISIRQIVEAVEGPLALNRCLLPEDACGRGETCPIANVWREAQDRLTEVLDRYTLAMFNGEMDGPGRALPM